MALIAAGSEHLWVPCAMLGPRDGSWCVRSCAAQASACTEDYPQIHPYQGLYTLQPPSLFSVRLASPLYN